MQIGNFLGLTYQGWSSAQGLTGIPGWLPIAIIILAIWSLVWKGLALWHASQRRQLNWFIVILVLNTIGILEIVYLFIIVKIHRSMKKTTEPERENEDTATQ